MEEANRNLLTNYVKRLLDPARLLPGGYLYLTDILGDPGNCSKGWENYCFSL